MNFLGGTLILRFAFYLDFNLFFAFNGEPIIPASKAVLECMGYEVGNATFPMKRYTDEEKLKIYNGVKKYLP